MDDTDDNLEVSEILSNDHMEITGNIGNCVNFNNAHIDARCVNIPQQLNLILIKLV